MTVPWNAGLGRGGMEDMVSGGLEDGFAALLRELKDRSGLSYGALAKRLHMSTSTLHRYCNGAAVPNEYAPVERLARVCRATPEELVELHRRWVLADAARGRGAERTEPSRPPAPTGTPVPPQPPATPEPVAPASDPAPDTPVVETTPSPASPPRRRRPVWLAAASAVVVLGAVGLALHPFAGPGRGDDGDRQAAGATAGAAPGSPAGGAGTAGSRTPSPSATPSPSPSAGGTSRGPSARPSASAAASAPASPSAGSAGDTTAVPLAVGVRPYVYVSPCSQHFLVDSEPQQVGPPAGEQDARRFADAYGAVSSDEQRIAVTVQGTGKDTVVLQALHVRVVAKGAPLAWNDYSMGVGCGGDVQTESFDIDLDSGSPTVAVGSARRDFPYKVSESDPEVFYITARTRAHDVRWELALDWSSGPRHGTIRIDNRGVPFRTSAGAGRPGYDYPLGGGEWIPRVQ
ncbi:helix-turn-helix domain-containing protein [Streptomyces griseosporeus]|uniref:helix-turn-helix domain-containing protein n=1 Tax=Streptomyces griseosporeus TaxID=1910 RepID=UPI0019A1BF28|nr:transcriptional regulator [Streptomyces griseosporeus]